MSKPLPDKAKEIADHFVGKKVLIVGDHPHADHVGIVESLDHTNAGYGFKVNCCEGGGTYVFDQRNWHVLNLSLKWE